MNVRKCQWINFKSQQTSSTCMIRGWSSTRQIPSATLGPPIKYIFPRLTPPKAQSIIKVTGHYKRSRWKNYGSFTWRVVPLCTDEWRNWQDELRDEKSFSKHKRNWSQAKNVYIYIFFLPRQLPLFISTLSIAISPVNEVPAIPSNVTCKECWVVVSGINTYYMLIGLINHAYTSLYLSPSKVRYYAG